MCSLSSPPTSVSSAASLPGWALGKLRKIKQKYLKRFRNCIALSVVETSIFMMGLEIDGACFLANQLSNPSICWCEWFAWPLCGASYRSSASYEGLSKASHWESNWFNWFEVVNDEKGKHILSRLISQILFLFCSFAFDFVFATASYIS